MSYFFRNSIFAKLFAIGIGAIILAGCTSIESSAHTPVVMDAYVKATDTIPANGSNMDAMMTGAFMTLVNDTGHDMTLVSGKSDFAPIVEIHEVVNGMMQKIEGGLLIKNGESAVLKPGGNHVMFMGITKPLTAGDEVTFTLIFDDKSELEVTAPVKIVNVEQEHYHSGEPTPSMSGM